MYPTLFGLVYDPVTDKLYASSYAAPAHPNPFISIDVNSVRATKLFDTGNLVGLAFDPTNGTLYGLDNGGGTPRGALYTINLQTGQETLVAQLPQLDNGAGLAFAEPVPEPVTFSLLTVGGLFVMVWFAVTRTQIRGSARGATRATL